MVELSGLDRTARKVSSPKSASSLVRTLELYARLIVLVGQDSGYPMAISDYKRGIYACKS